LTVLAAVARSVTRSATGSRPSATSPARFFASCQFAGLIGSDLTVQPERQPPLLARAVAEAEAVRDRAAREAAGHEALDLDVGQVISRAQCVDGPL